jgi:hypothetical protein
MLKFDLHRLKSNKSNKFFEQVINTYINLPLSMYIIKFKEDLNFLIDIKALARSKINLKQFKLLNL